jgi:hypothetical protein
MIKIDLATASNTLIVTLRERSVQPQPTYKLEMFNFFTNETFLWSNLTSIADNRKDRIQLTTSQEFLGRTPSVGQYKYQFFEYLSGTYGNTYSLVESGMAKVVDSSPGTSEYVSIDPIETDDDYITIS